MALRKSQAASYARRRKLSQCRGLRARTCNKTVGCKNASGRKRSFCRKTKSRRRVSVSAKKHKETSQISQKETSQISQKETSQISQKETSQISQKEKKLNI